MTDFPQPVAPEPDATLAARLRKAVLLVAMFNLVYAFIEMAVAAVIGSVSLFADSVDFLEDAAVNLLVFVALRLLRDDDGSRRSRWGKVAAVIILFPAVAAAYEAVDKALHPAAPTALPLVLTAGGALLVNSVCAWILARHRHAGGSLTRVAWLAARNDVIINIAIIAMGLLTAYFLSVRSPYAWLPDVILGVVIIVLNLGAAKEVWEVAESERLAARALAGEDLDD